MKKARRILTLLLIMVMALTAVPVTVGAASIYDTAVAITSGKTVKTTLYKGGEDRADYKINVSKSGELKINITTCMYECDLYLYDSDGNAVKPTSDSSTSGSIYTYKSWGWTELSWNSTVEKYSGTITYPVNKGTYYIRLNRSYPATGYGDGGSGAVTLTATAPTSTPKTKISYLSLTLSKGATLQLGAVVSPTGSKVTWKSSKPSVATVSSNGKITAKAKGATIITAKCGTSTQKIRIVVK